MRLDVHRFQATGHDLGVAIGTQFKQQIHGALADNTELHERFRPYHNSAEGQALYQQLLALHEHHYPGTVSELRGYAKGAEVSFEDLFLTNLRGEYRGYAAVTDIPDIGECSTSTLLNADYAVFGHNEDGAEFYRDRSYLIHVQPQDEIPFLALCYPGFLPSNAFGANRSGLCYAINNVRPSQVRLGLGRHFLARSLLQAHSIEDALACLKVEPRAAGFNFTIASIAERRILNVEVSPDQIHVHEISEGYFHANHYCHLDLLQQCEPSSVARQNRGNELLAKGIPANQSEVLEVLRDQTNQQLPIWRLGRDPDPAVTLLSAVFDLDNKCLSVYPGPLDEPQNPQQPLLDLSLAEPNFGKQL